MTCITCHRTLPDHHFHRDKYRRWGIKTRCRRCTNARAVYRYRFCPEMREAARVRAAAARTEARP
jgi:hypothetical protein